MRAKNFLRSCLFYGTFVGFICGYGPTLFADSTNVIVPTSDPAHQMRRLVASIVTTPANQYFTSVKATDTIYSRTILPMPICPTGAYQTQYPAVRYKVTGLWYNYHTVIHCGGSVSKCNSPDNTPLDAIPLPTQSTTSPGSVCAPRPIPDINNPGPPPACTTQDGMSSKQCYWYMCGIDAGSWYPVYIYTPDVNGDFYPYMCVTHGWQPNIA